MRRITSSRPSPAIVAAVLGLVVAMAGTAIAADPLAKALTKTKVKKIANKEIDKRFPIGTGQIADGAVSGAKLADSAVNGGKIADGAVGGAKLADGSVTGGKFGTTVLRSTDLPVPGTSVNAGTASCNPGERMLSGGGQYLTADAQVLLVSSYPESVSSWNVRAYNQSATEKTVRIWALCLQG